MQPNTDVRLSPGSTLTGLALVAGLGLGPLVLESRPLTPVEPFSSPLLSWLGKGLVVLALVGVVVLRAWLDRRADPWPLRLTLGLVTLSGLMTACHWQNLDVPYRDDIHTHYLDVLNNRIDPPHPYRPLPYGFIRSLEQFTGDWAFSSLMYRWFFSYWFIWGWYRFARLFHSPARSLATLLAVPLFYPMSLAFYAGQPTDPVSHALFVLALIAVVQNDHYAVLAGLLALGVTAKETVVIVVPAYWACYWRGGWSAFVRTVGLGLACVAAFLAMRLPLGWRPAGSQSVNGTNGLMIDENLGIGTPTAWSSVPRHEYLLRPALFLGLFLPVLIWGWGRLDHRLRSLALVLTPLLFASSLCFSWTYEARNYMPLLPLLTTMIVAVVRPPAAAAEAPSAATSPVPAPVPGDARP